MAICTAVYFYLRPPLDLLLVGILVVDNLCGRFDLDWILDYAGIPRWLVEAELASEIC